MSSLTRHLAQRRRPDVDSRIRGVSIGSRGRIAPRFVDAGKSTVNGVAISRLVEHIYCASCGRRQGGVTPDLPPGVIAVCDDCTRTAGPLPLELVSYQPDHFDEGV